MTQQTNVIQANTKTGFLEVVKTIGLGVAVAMAKEAGISTAQIDLWKLSAKYKGVPAVK